MKKILYLIIGLIIANYAFADNYPTGAAEMSMGNSTVAIPGLWSVYHNQAALAFVDGINAGIYYENRFNFMEFAVKSLAFTMNTDKGTFAADITSFGFSKYSDNKFGIAYALKLSDILSAGIQLDYFLIHQGAYYGNIGAVTGEIGIFSNPFENFYLAAHLFNPWRTKIVSYQDERLPTIFRIGASYDFSEQVKTSFEIMKDIDLPTFYKLGIQYEPIDKLQLRTGVYFSGNNVQFSFGLGYSFNGLTIDLGFENHPVLGFKSGVSVQYRFK